MQEYKKKLLKICLPIIVSNLIAQLQMLIDRIFLGRLDILNMSAVGNATAPVWTTMSFVFSLSIGASILISQSMGASNKEKALDYASSLIKFNNIVPVLLFLFWEFCCKYVYQLMGVSENVIGLCITYTKLYAPSFLIIGLGASYGVIFQTSNYTKPLVVFGLIRSSLNIILDYLLIFGNFGFPRMEIAGAALGTTIAEYIGALCLVVFIFFKGNKFSTNPPLKSILKAKFLPYLKSAKLGVNTALEDFIWNFGNLAIIRILNAINETAAGIYSLVFAVEILAVVIVGSIGNGTLTLTGEATGAKDLKQFRNVVKTSYFWCAIVATLFLTIVSIFPKQVLSILTKDENIIETSVVFIILVAVNLFGKAGNIIVGNGIRGFGDTKWMLFTQVFGTLYIVGMASLFVFVFKFGMIGVYLAVISDEILRGCINTVRLSRIKF